MSVVVIKKEEIAAVVKKPDALIVYLKTGKYFVCEPEDPRDDGENKHFTLKGRRK